MSMKIVGPIKLFVGPSEDEMVEVRPVSGLTFDYGTAEPTVLQVVSAPEMELTAQICLGKPIETIIDERLIAAYREKLRAFWEEEEQRLIQGIPIEPPQGLLLVSGVQIARIDRPAPVTQQRVRRLTGDTTPSGRRGSRRAHHRKVKR